MAGGRTFRISATICSRRRCGSWRSCRRASICAPPVQPVYDQGQTESCTGDSIAGAIQYERMQQKLPNADSAPSRLFIYYNERVLEHDVAQDGGGQIRDGIKAAVSKGACFETGDNAWAFEPT